MCTNSILQAEVPKVFLSYLFLFVFTMILPHGTAHAYYSSSLYSGGLFGSGLYGGDLFGCGGIYSGGLYGASPLYGGMYSGGLFDSSLYGGDIFGGGGIYSGGLYSGSGLYGGDLYSGSIYGASPLYGGMYSGSLYGGRIYGSSALYGRGLFGSALYGSGPATQPFYSAILQEAVLSAATTYLSAPDIAPVITAQSLYNLIYDGDPSNDPLIVSVREPEHYQIGHIPGAINIPWLSISAPETLNRLPKDRLIVVYCYTGHKGGIAAAILNMLGYNALNLKFGIMAWTIDPAVRVSSPFTEGVDSHNFPINLGSKP